VHGTIRPVSQPTPPPSGGARYQRSAGGMAGALIVTVLAVVAFVGFRALNREPLEVEPEPVDYLPVVAQAQQLGGEPAYPPRLPDGWIATSVDLRSGEAGAWGLGLLTDTDTFAGVRQGGDSLDGLLQTYVDENPTEGEAVEIDTEVATRWRTFSDGGGDRAYAAEVAGQPLLVFGSATDADLRLLLSLLTTAPVARG
jgi:Protein of unknown function (DUF4245)